MERLEFEKLNPNLGELQEYFDGILRRFFDADGRPRDEYFERVPCPICGTGTVIAEFVARGFRHVRCAECGMVYVSPRLKESVMEEFYGAEAYDRFFEIKLIPAVEYRYSVIARRKYAQIARYFPQPGRVLDIGSGLGEVLAVLKEHGWDCTGVEINRRAVEFSRRRFGLNIIHGSVLKWTPSGPFDLIMLWGVLEHFTRPKEVLRQCFEFLRPGGLLLVEVPSGDSLLVRYVELHGGDPDRIIEGDRHTMLYSIEGLKRLTREAKFEPVAILSNGLDFHTVTSMHGCTLPAELLGNMQDALDSLLHGDLLRGFFRKPA